ncbi:enoyl-CoA hydratase domain-containing protein 3, mitochondrial-like isoform X2 [Xenia sp. Carnegie-2017]|uniref:enoyl-CoA hydratase domain-containing protein 3, mitochondrial-like isoform X2 n=1 Tax=Xenia sp. Carnegie-2017 TaxID=2897299 RepID=UPI001F03AC7B|nr:enoyl-CoA hydratase domain-containing protein 3, mitochondrial-like isoform X2 [Xenia sp. Carnegie-2017]
MISRTIYNFLKTSTKEKVFTRFSSKNSENVQQSHLTLCNVVNGIGKIVLNNPLKRNALSLAMLKSIENGLMENVVKKSHVVIISANGTVFSSGHDLKELDIPIPVIAQVKGLATAAGCQLVASCDMAVAATNAMFATPGVNIGLFCSTPAVAVSRAVPHKIAMEMLFTGQPIFAKDALQYGLVNKVVPEEKLEEVTLNLAQQICKTSQPVVAMGKKCYYQQITQNRNDAYRIAGQVMVDNLKLKDGNEGIEAFLNKRKPLWTHEE